jgi:hypothetical protein
MFQIQLRYRYIMYIDLKVRIHDIFALKEKGDVPKVQNYDFKIKIQMKNVWEISSLIPSLISTSLSILNELLIIMTL